MRHQTQIAQVAKRGIDVYAVDALGRPLVQHCRKRTSSGVGVGPRKPQRYVTIEPVKRGEQFAKLTVAVAFSESDGVERYQQVPSPKRCPQGGFEGPSFEQTLAVQMIQAGAANYVYAAWIFTKLAYAQCRQLVRDEMNV